MEIQSWCVSSDTIGAWCTELTRSSLMIVSTSHAVNGCSPRVPLVSCSQTTFFFYIGAGYKRKKMVWLYVRLGVPQGANKLNNYTTLTLHAYTNTHKYTHLAIERFILLELYISCGCHLFTGCSVSSKFAQFPYDK